MKLGRETSEFANARVGDERLTRRLETIGAAMAADPSASFPDAMASAADLEGLYRFLNNERVDPAAILAPHVRATTGRIAGGTIAIVHDTTDFVFDGVPGEALGYIPRTSQRGFCGHFALAVAEGGDALGVLGLETMFFNQKVRGVIRRNRAAAAKMYKQRIDKAAFRWDRMIVRTRSLVPDGTSSIHVMDREADSYRLFALMTAGGDRFVVRARHDRRARTTAATPWMQVTDVAERAEHFCEREVPLSKRRREPGLNATYGARNARTAQLKISASPITIKKPGLLKDVPHSLSLNLVRVVEVAAPSDSEPVEWLLLTTEPISSAEEVEAIVDWYRRRWIVEEFFRALKTGCAYQRRQLESRAALLRTLALLIPLAWQLLALRDAARRTPKRAARTVLRESQLIVLRALTKKKLSKSPSVEEALLAVAGQGGHLRNNGRPGWQTLGRGIEKLQWAELGYLIALKKPPEK